MRLTLPRFPFGPALDARGTAMVEFGLAAPMLAILGCGGLELANYITTKLRISQVALQMADNASRMGDLVQGIKKVSEANINETFAGANLQGGALNIQTKGKIILSSLEPVASPNTTSRYKIKWQRCYGSRVASSSYGVQGATDLTGMGPTGRLVTAQDYDATMFVEVSYTYTPLFTHAFLPTGPIKEIAAMAVRDPRKLDSAPESTGTASTC